MRFVQISQAREIGEHIGFGFGLFMFFSILYLILRFTHKLPESIFYLHVLILIVSLYAVRAVWFFTRTK